MNVDFGVDPGFRPAASTLGSALPARWAGATASTEDPPYSTKSLRASISGTGPGPSPSLGWKFCASIVKERREGQILLGSFPPRNLLSSCCAPLRDLPPSGAQRMYVGLLPVVEGSPRSGRLKLRAGARRSLKTWRDGGLRAQGRRRSDRSGQSPRGADDLTRGSDELTPGAGGLPQGADDLPLGADDLPPGADDSPSGADGLPPRARTCPPPGWPLFPVAPSEALPLNEISRPATRSGRTTGASCRSTISSWPKVEELGGRAQTAGLQVSHLWGDHDRRPWDQATSPRLIAELRP